MTQRYEKMLGEICDLGGGFIKTGPFGSQLHQSDYKVSGTPVVMPKNIIEDKVDEADIARIGEKDVERLSQHQLNAGDIVYGRRGDIGRQALITDKEEGWLCGTGCLRIHLGTESPVKPTFLHYYLKQSHVIEWIYNQAIGATMPNLNTSILWSVPIVYPNYELQHKIASILSTYDDLIENNLHRIRILEEIAQLIYREWFVKFRFPGHEKVKMVDSPLGEIPEGWEVGSVQDMCTLIKRGISPKYDDDSNSVVINQRCIRDFKINLEPSRRHITKVSLEKYVQFGDVLINSTGVGTLGRVAQVLIEYNDTTVDSHVTIVRPNKAEVDVHFFGLQLFSLQKHFERQGQGATGQTELGRQSIGETSFIVPTKNIQDLFCSSVDQMRLLPINLLAKNNILRQTRDLLLPKLISGQLDVFELEIDIGEPAA